MVTSLADVDRAINALGVGSPEYHEAVAFYCMTLARAQWRRADGVRAHRRGEIRARAEREDEPMPNVAHAGGIVLVEIKDGEYIQPSHIDAIRTVGFDEDDPRTEVRMESGYIVTVNDTLERTIERLQMLLAGRRA